MKEFFAMGGFGFFIWSSFGMTALLMLAEVFYLKRQRHTIIKRLRRLQRMSTPR
ncbi:MAG TPA: heme exporter protein CcmD [Gammaproteobacteria bacterium]|nr:heme exporter protein CcmD [Gammaproteobacteria bacterium]